MLSVAEASFPPELVRDSSTPLRYAQNDRAIEHRRERGKMSFKTAFKNLTNSEMSDYLYCLCILYRGDRYHETLETHR